MPDGGVIVAQDVHFSEGGVGFGEFRVKANGLEEKAEGFVGFEGHAVELRQMVIRLGVGGFAEDPGTLLFDGGSGFAIEGEIDDFLAPKTHFPDPTR